MGADAVTALKEVAAPLLPTVETTAEALRRNLDKMSSKELDDGEVSSPPLNVESIDAQWFKAKTENCAMRKALNLIVERGVSEFKDIEGELDGMEKSVREGISAILQLPEKQKKTLNGPAPKPTAADGIWRETLMSQVGLVTLVGTRQKHML